MDNNIAITSFQNDKLLHYLFACPVFSRYHCRLRSVVLGQKKRPSQTHGKRALVSCAHSIQPKWCQHVPSQLLAKCSTDSTRSCLLVLDACASVFAALLRRSKRVTVIFAFCHCSANRKLPPTFACQQTLLPAIAATRFICRNRLHCRPAARQHNTGALDEPGFRLPNSLRHLSHCTARKCTATTRRISPQY